MKIWMYLNAVQKCHAELPALLNFGSSELPGAKYVNN